MATAATPAQAFPAPSGSTLRSWITTVDHKRIGLLYLLVTMFFFLTGGLMALVIRLQLETASGTVVSAETYDQIFTMHGTTMVFLFVVPVMAAFGNYMVPLQIGARDMAFPKLNAASFWLLLFGGTVMYSSFAFGGAPDAGWTGYPPLSVISPGHGIDFWIVGLHILSLSSILGAINFICTIHNMRAPGMRLTRMPLFTWCIDFYSIMIVAALPVLSGALTMLLLDRNYGTHFFTANGGNPVLYQHFFWFFGHPEVYVVALPGFGMISEILPVFSRKPIFGYKALVYSIAAIAFLGFLVWGHHMFAVGFSTPVDIWFMVASLAIAVPTGVKIFNWIGTLWMGRIRYEPPMLFAIGFILLFMIGGLSGVFLAHLLDRPAGHRQLLRRRPFPLRDGIDPGVRRDGWPALLVSEDDRPYAQPQPRHLELLGAVRGLQPDVLPDARDGTLRNAAPYLQLSPAPRLGAHERDRHSRLVRDLAGRAPDRLQLPHVAPQRPRGRRRPLAGEHARVVHQLAAACSQLRLAAADPQRTAAGRPARRGGGGGGVTR